ncbi:MAG: hypothetical protein OEV40_23140 [Acidimicrobiia bacterium]|nr:hypothetical protein [Acidimicrobiia bacterium]
MAADQSTSLTSERPRRSAQGAPGSDPSDRSVELAEPGRVSKVAGCAGLVVLAVVWARATADVVSARSNLADYAAANGPLPLDENGRIDHGIPEIQALCDAIGGTGSLFYLAGWFLFPLLALAWCYCSALAAPRRWPRFLLWSSSAAGVTALLQLVLFAGTIAEVNRILQ